jgi:hypothetical protein
MTDPWEQRRKEYRAEQRVELRLLETLMHQINPRIRELRAILKEGK